MLKSKGISMYRLSKDTGIAYQTLWKLDTGRSYRLGFDVLEKIADRLGCDPGELFVKVPGERPEKGESTRGAKED
jgi:DNA-binding Xre family transcriptional regulator